jgi:uncharacterized protein YjiS (DUF1127 family)
MYRFELNKNATPAAAMTPATIASGNINYGHADGGESLAEILSRPFKQARIARELRMLDTRALSDIGISPADIDRVAVESVGGKNHSLVISLIKYAARKVSAWAQRRDAYRSLMALDDRMLTDIGLSRAEIPAVVKAMSGGLLGRSFDSSFEADVILPLKQWNLSRAAHKQLNQLDNHMLNDIGLVRSDIDLVAEELASRAVTKPANANTAAPRAA